ncbi:MAG: endosialidase [Epulopiscium sp. Nele67-Bin002]|nr:MAG: endosialidase [Epulopiscium sp. Nuni2H_MBin001]OON91717.1 MAG: endosialidase [Epulopiscium sp. Nele67-Bin002]OON94283.1 MAG: endosialidase [Epulopiscium sp. Nele67-Bin001]
MAIVEEIIRKNADNTLSFGNHELTSKTKVLDFDLDGSSYKAKSFNEVTKLKKEGKLVYESLPGTTVHNFKVTDDLVSFMLEGFAASQITLELTPTTSYEFKVDNDFIAKVTTTATGKVNISVVATNEPKLVELIRV